MSFAAKLNRLFDTVYPPGRKPYSSAEAVEALRSRGHSISAPYLSQLRSGNRDNPSSVTVVALANFFGVDPAYFTDDETAGRIEEELVVLSEMRARAANPSLTSGRHRAPEAAFDGSNASAPVHQATPVTFGDDSLRPPALPERPMDSESTSVVVNDPARAERVSYRVDDASEATMSVGSASITPSNGWGSQDMENHEKSGSSSDLSDEESSTDRVLAVDRGSRLFKFLSEVQSLKIPRVTNVQAYAHEGMVLWLSRVPVHEDVHVEFRDGDTGSPDAVLKVNRVVAEEPPAIPAGLTQWLDGGITEPSTPPTLQIFRQTGARTSDGVEILDRIEDHPDIRQGFDEWRVLWDRWAEQNRRDKPIIDLYQMLFSSYLRLSDHPEEYELVVAAGALGWAPSSGTLVKRHLLTCPAEISFDDSSAAITVELRPQLENIRVETDMLLPGQLNAPEHVNAIREDARLSEHHLLDRLPTGDLLSRLVNTLDAAGRFTASDEEPACGSAPEVSFAPALIVRKRSRLGLKEIFDKIVRQIAETGRIPSGLLPLIDPDFEPKSEASTVDGALVQVDEEVFSPLPLNPVQLEILHSVDRRAQTVVQGPPGTGKTHTAAALLSHLLAQGKRVLVTAQTDQALKEVRSKLPKEVKPLAVAVIGSAQSDMADLKVAVEQISAESSAHEPGRAERDIQDCLNSIDRLRRERAEFRSRIVDARQADVERTNFAGYSGTLADIAVQCNAETDSYEWCSEYFPSRTEADFPVSTSDLLRWLELLRDDFVSDNEAEAKKRLVQLNQIPDPLTLANLIDAEATAATAAAQFNSLKSHSAYPSIVTMPATDRANLKQQMNELAQKARDLEARNEQWIALALSDVRSGRGATWRSRADVIRGMISELNPLVGKLSANLQVTISTDSDRGVIESMARSLRDHLEASGPIKTNPDGTPKISTLTNRVVKNSRPLFDAVRVNRRVPTAVDDVTVLLAYLDADQRLDALDRAWPSIVTIRDEDTHWERLQWHKTELEQLSRVLEFAADIDRGEKQVNAMSLTPPDWADTGAIIRYSDLVDGAEAAEAQSISSEPLFELARQLESECSRLGSSSSSAPLLESVTGRDRSAYEAAYLRIQTLNRVKEKLEDRDGLTAIVSAAAPALAVAVLTNPAERVWDGRLASVPDAWNWSRASEWVRARDNVDVNALQGLIKGIDSQLEQQISRLAALRAWKHAISPSRLTGRSRADLMHYAQLVRRLGKGTGKYAVQRHADIRSAMIRCREAVPVWIMPLYRIADQLDVTQNMFDVVIVDEASQAGLEASFLQYLAPKIVVIGDDKQVSPAAVGVDQQQLRDLANMYLRDDPYRSSWEDPKQSFFDEAVKRFGSRLTLREHRRCVPEIIGFSNRIAYAPENIPLQAVRQCGSDRLEPIKMVRIVDGYQKGKTVKTNPPEVDAIVDQVVKCISDERYRGKTIGIISLQGPPQAQAIETALMPKVDPKEWSLRELRCGDAASFQGSERDIIFLSMVAARDEDRRLGASVGATYIQRYNVATSRAKDQLWLFHSIDMSDVPNKEDMRHELLDYCQSVVTRWNSRTETAHLSPVSEDVRVDPFDSLFEQRVYNRIIDRGLIVEPQYEAAGYKIDLVIVRGNYRLAVECDGDAWHGPREYERDLARQRDLERCGWRFFRIRESEFYIDQHAVLSRLWETIDAMDSVVLAGVQPDPNDEAREASQLQSRDVEATEPTATPDHAYEPSAGNSVLTMTSYQPDNPSEGATGSMMDATSGDEHSSQFTSVGNQLDQRNPNSLQVNFESPELGDKFGGETQNSRIWDSAVVEPTPPPTRVGAVAFHDGVGGGLLGPTVYEEASSTPIGERFELDHPESEHIRTKLQVAVDDAILSEGPIELSRLTRGIVRRFGFDRAKAQRQDVVRGFVPRELIRSDDFGTFVWPRGLDPLVWRGFRRTPSGLSRPLDEIAAEEIINTLAHVARDQTAELEVLMRDTLAIFDLRRLTRQSTERLENCILRAVSIGRLVKVGERYSVQE